MSVLPVEDQRGTISVGRSEQPGSSVKDKLVGITFAIVAGAAMAGWLYLLAMVLWASIAWLVL